MLEEMITLYHLRDWYGNVSKSETTNHKEPYKNLRARKKMHNAETKASPSQESRDLRASRTGNILIDSWIRST